MNTGLARGLRRKVTRVTSQPKRKRVKFRLFLGVMAVLSGIAIVCVSFLKQLM